MSLVDAARQAAQSETETSGRQRHCATPYMVRFSAATYADMLWDMWATPQAPAHTASRKPANSLLVTPGEEVK
jgi:hypothetical protein